MLFRCIKTCRSLLLCCCWKIAEKVVLFFSPSGHWVSFFRVVTKSRFFFTYNLSGVVAIIKWNSQSYGHGRVWVGVRENTSVFLLAFLLSFSSFFSFLFSVQPCIRAVTDLFLFRPLTASGFRAKFGTFSIPMPMPFLVYVTMYTCQCFSEGIGPCFSTVWVARENKPPTLTRLWPPYHHWVPQPPRSCCDFFFFRRVT